MNHRIPPKPESWNDEPGICRWCGCCIIGLRGPKKGQHLLNRRWHPGCVTEYQFIFWPGTMRDRLLGERGKSCEDCRATAERYGSLRGPAEIHHIIPLVDYPHDPRDPYAAWRRENLVVLCHSCHLARHLEINAAKKPQMRLFGRKALDNPGPNGI